MSLIRIINPLGVHDHIGRKHADRYVKRGDAKYVGNALLFLRKTDSKREQAVQKSLRPFAPGGLATLDQVQGLPCAGPAIRIFYGPRATVAA